MESQQQHQNPQAAPSSTDDGSQQGLQGPGIRQHCFRHTDAETTIDYQIMDLGRQLYIWVGSGQPEMSTAFLAIQTHMDKMPCVTSLLPSSATNTGSSIAQRLALKTGRPVMLSWNVPSSTTLLEAAAERRLLQELVTLNLISTGAAKTAATPQ